MTRHIGDPDWGWESQIRRRDISKMSHNYPGHERRMRMWTDHYERLGLSGSRQTPKRTAPRVVPPPKPPPPPVLTPTGELAAIVARLGLDPAAFPPNPHLRKRAHVRARWVVMKVLREQGWKLVTIASVLGFDDHMAVIYGLRRVRGEMLARRHGDKRLVDAA